MRRGAAVVALLVFALGARGSEMFTVASWNVLFDDRTGSLRYPQIFDHLAAHPADVICLQECTPAFRELLRESALAGTHAIHHGGQEGRYFNLILTAVPARDEGIVELESEMGRAAPWIEVDVHGDAVRIYSLHLESTDAAISRRLRRAQLAAVVEATGERPAILAGDFNFPDGAPEEALLPPAAHDPGAGADPTWDPTRNSLAAAAAGDDEEPGRLDRILLLNSDLAAGYRMQAVSYSDHFPVRITLDGSRRAPAED